MGRDGPAQPGREARVLAQRAAVTGGFLTGTPDADDSRTGPQRHDERDRDADNSPQRRPAYNDLRDDYDEDYLATPTVIAQRRVFVPALAILVIGVFGVVGMLVAALAAILDFVHSRGGDERLAIMVILLWIIGIGLVLFSLVIAGGISLMRLRRYGLALFAAYVVTGLAIAGLYAILFFPFGIWAMILLYRPDIRKEFRRPLSTVDDRHA